MDLQLGVQCQVAPNGEIIFEMGYMPFSKTGILLPSEEAAIGFRDAVIEHVNQAIRLAKPRRMGLIIPEGGKLPSFENGQERNARS